MISSEVWNDAFSRAGAAATAMGLSLVDPLLQDVAARDSLYWIVPIGAASSDRMGAGEIQNEEAGQVILTLMIRKGKASTPDVLTYCQAMSAAFRAPLGIRPKDWPKGLSYYGQDFSPPDLSETGNWYAATLMISYSYQTKMQTA